MRDRGAGEWVGVGNQGPGGAAGDMWKDDSD